MVVVQARRGSSHALCQPRIHLLRVGDHSGL
jgi:hypothetical protein